jgi:hypothetical protein
MDWVETRQKKKRRRDFMFSGNEGIDVHSRWELCGMKEKYLRRTFKRDLFKGVQVKN